MIEILCEVGKAMPRIYKYSSTVCTLIGRYRTSELIQAILEDELFHGGSNQIFADPGLDARIPGRTSVATRKRQRTLQDFNQMISAKLERDYFENCLGRV
jgi:hypothetical protein